MAEKITQLENGKQETNYTVCQEFLKSMYLVMDGEASKVEEEYFYKHIESSKDCFKEFSDEKVFRKFFKEQCACKQLAKDQIEKIRSLILKQKA